VTREPQIRTATVDDAGAISQILREAFAQFEGDYTPDAFDVVRPPVEEIVRRFEEGRQWLALVDGEPVGTVSVLPEPEWLYIRSMAVLPAAQGLGVGNLLLQSVEQYAVEAGFEKLFLYTTYFSQSAIRLYEKNGFYWVRDTPADEWFGTPGLAMEKLVGRKTENVVGS
jgi:N-acetylglutamate synthase-like GNAT family acetyltransferase